MVIHLTDRRVFKTCRRKFYWNNVRRIISLGEGVTPYFELGKVGHECLARYYQGDLQWLDPIEESDTLSEDQKTQLRFLLENYPAQYPEDKRLMVPQAIETRIDHEIEIDGYTIVFRATFDLLYIDKRSRKFFIMDHKFLSNPANRANLELDDQLTGYIWLAKRLGFPILGAYYNVFLKRLFTEPYTPSGKISRAKRTLDNCTYEMYFEAITKCGENPEDYREELDYLKTTPPTLYERHLITKTDEQLENYERDLFAELRDIVRILRSKNIHEFYPNPTFLCTQCSFKELCHMQNQGADVEQIIPYQFREKEESER